MPSVKDGQTVQLKLENVCFRYRTPGSSGNNVLDDISFGLNKGELTALVGPSGSGKTTLMQHLTGLLKPASGTICFNGQNIWSSSTDLDNIRRRIGLVFQFPETQLFEETVFADIAFGLSNLTLPQQDIERKVAETMKLVGLDYDEFRDRIPFHLSAGEKRRVAIAGILVLDPDILVLDEPTAGLDDRGTKAVTRILCDYHRKRKTVLIISHNLDWLLSLTERFIVIDRGKIKFDGTKTDFIKNGEILHRLGWPLPRIELISRKLISLGLLKKGSYFTIEDLTGALSKDISEL